MLNFGLYQLDTSSGELRKRGLRIKLQPMPKRILLTLIVQPGQVVQREVLYGHMWPQGSSADCEHGLNTAVKKLRAALHDKPEQPRFIETVPGCGYRFIAEVSNATTAGEMGPGRPQPAKPLDSTASHSVQA